ncbi:YciI family protein [Amycolatopsis sp. H20-H5]|uniref:YciI family protein n=1 Tax=Amycolatopsis sp. H20-H5 TaxID=3046309 RepID=UPI002DB8964F|nr:YciI family protein [Amycolatopsis sp. H20-H5]MEC3981115.1 YciI family protein [Amycolatopsis sp. H20-H5]
MRFMIIRKADPETEAGLMPSEELMSAMGEYNKEMAEAGVLLMGDGLRASSFGARVEFAGGSPTVTDGPFTESKELIAGFSIIEVASKAEAVEWVRGWPVLDGGGSARIELRQLFEPEDFATENLSE